MSALEEELTSGELPELEPDAKPASAPKGRSKRPTTRAGRAAASRARRAGKPSLAPGVQAFLELGGSVWSIQDAECGGALLEQAGAIAEGLNLWAQSDDKVYAAVSRWMEGGGAGALVFALWPLALQVSNHHLVPAVERARERRAARLEEAAEAEAAYYAQEPPSRDEPATIIEPEPVVYGGPEADGEAPG